MRMNNSRSVKKVQQAKMTGKRKRGDTRKTWENSIPDILKEKMSRGMRQVRKCETRKNGQGLYVKRRSNT